MAHRPLRFSAVTPIRYSGSMFRRRPRPKAPRFEERIQGLRQAGFVTADQPDGRVRVSRGASVAIIEGSASKPPSIVLTGRLLGGDVTRLVDAGFQKFWRTSDGRDTPALAEHLGDLHTFQEDLREALGLISLYHTSLGTTNDLHLYDRATPPSASKSL